MRQRLPTILGFAGAALSGAVAVFYLVLIVRGLIGVSGDGGRVAIVAVVLFAQTGVTFYGALRSSVLWLGIATVLLLVTGVLGMFSIGAPLALAGICTACAAGAIHMRRVLAAVPSRARSGSPTGQPPPGRGGRAGRRR